MKTFPTPETLRRLPFGLADIVVILSTFVLLAIITKLGQGTLVSFNPPEIIPKVQLAWVITLDLTLEVMTC